MKIVHTDTLKVEFFQLAMIDTSVRYCYRIVEPVEMMWQNDCRITPAMSLCTARYDVLKLFFLGKWRGIIEESYNQNNAAWPEELDWLKEVNKVECVECELTPKNTTNVVGLIDRMGK